MGPGRTVRVDVEADNVMISDGETRSRIRAGAPTKNKILLTRLPIMNLAKSLGCFMLVGTFRDTYIYFLIRRSADLRKLLRTSEI